MPCRSEMTPNSVVLAVADLITPQIMDELMFVLTKDVSFVLPGKMMSRTASTSFMAMKVTQLTRCFSALESEIEDDSSLEIRMRMTKRVLRRLPDQSLL